jgi:hypothetical protein
MKRIKDVALLLALVSIAGFLLISCCARTVQGPIGFRLSVYSEFSFPSIFLTDGDVDYSNPFNPMTGTDVTGATVVVSNETTGVSTTLTWVPASGNMQRGSYGGYQQELPHDAGESVSLRIEAGEDVVTGGPTITPNSSAALVTPAHNSFVTLPTTISWTIITNTFPATHAFVTVQAQDGSVGYLTVVPINQTSFELTSEHISAPGIYWVTVWPINQMNLTDAKNGSVGYVKSTTLSYSHTVTILAPTP